MGAAVDDQDAAFHALLMDPTTRFEGRVMSFNHNSKWGFINHEDFFINGITDAPDKGIFFHCNDVAAGRQLAKGEQVFFSLTSKPDGKLQAVNIKTPDSQAGVVDPRRRYSGTVVSFSTNSRWGFVECKELKSLFPEDIFFHCNDFSYAERIDKGTALTYIIDETSKPGKPQARQIQYVADSAGNKGHGRSKGVAILAPKPAVVVPPPRRGAFGSFGAPQDDPDTFEGTILSWNQANAWGFVTSPTTEALLGAGFGIFCHIKDFVNVPHDAILHPGMVVRFTLDLDEKGKNHAKKVQLLDVPIQGHRTASVGHAGAVSSTASAGVTGIEKFTGKQLEGVVMSYVEHKAWGFIQSPALVPALGEGVGVFFHLNDFEGEESKIPHSGLPVAFVCTVDEKGKLHAKQVKPRGAPKRVAPPSAAGIREHGDWVDLAAQAKRPRLW